MKSHLTRNSTRKPLLKIEDGPTIPLMRNPLAGLAVPTVPGMASSYRYIQPSAPQLTHSRRKELMNDGERAKTRAIRKRGFVAMS